MLEDERRILADADIRIVETPVVGLSLRANGIVARTGGSAVERFQSIYIAVDLRGHSALAGGLGAAHAEDGALRVEPHHQTSVYGHHAAGDVVQGLAQISVAIG